MEEKSNDCCENSWPLILRSDQTIETLDKFRELIGTDSWTEIRMTQAQYIQYNWLLRAPLEGQDVKQFMGIPISLYAYIKTKKAVQTKEKSVE